MINLELLKNPFNWIIVILMLTIAGMAATVLCKHFGGDTAISTE